MILQSNVSTFETKLIGLLWYFYKLINLHKSQHANQHLLVQETSAYPPKTYSQSDVLTFETKSVCLCYFYTLVNLYKSQYTNGHLLVQETSAKPPKTYSRTRTIVTVGLLLSHCKWKVVAAQPCWDARQQRRHLLEPGSHILSCLM